MKRAIGTILLLATPLLHGCNATLETELTVLDLLYGKTRMLPADFYIEVADCQDADSAKPARGSLQERQQTIAAIFSDSQYRDCAERDGRHMAHFRIPIAFDKDRDGELASEDHVNLVSTDDAFLMVVVPASLKDRVESVVGHGVQAGALGIGVEAKIKIQNDHGNPLPFQVFSVYINEQPFIFGDVTLPEGGSLTLRLSDVSIDSAIENGSSILLMRNKE